MEHLIYKGQRLDLILGQWLVTAAFHLFDEHWTEVTNLCIKEEKTGPVLGFEVFPIKTVNDLHNFITAMDNANSWAGAPVASKVQIKMWKNLADHGVLPTFYVRGPGSYEFADEAKDLKPAFTNCVEMYKRAAVRFADLVSSRVCQILIREPWGLESDLLLIDNLCINHAETEISIFQVVEEKDMLTKKSEENLSKNGITDFRKNLIKVLKGGHSLVNIIMVASGRNEDRRHINTHLHKKAVCYKLGEPDFGGQKQEWVCELSCELAKAMSERKTKNDAALEAA